LYHTIGNLKLNGKTEPDTSSKQKKAGRRVGGRWMLATVPDGHENIVGPLKMVPECPSPGSACTAQECSCAPACAEWVSLTSFAWVLDPIAVYTDATQDNSEKGKGNSKNEDDASRPNYQNYETWPEAARMGLGIDPFTLAELETTTNSATHEQRGFLGGNDEQEEGGSQRASATKGGKGVGDKSAEQLKEEREVFFRHRELAEYFHAQVRGERVAVYLVVHQLADPAVLHFFPAADRPLHHAVRRAQLPLDQPDGAGVHVPGAGVPHGQRVGASGAAGVVHEAPRRRVHQQVPAAGAARSGDDLLPPGRERRRGEDRS
jgi:hypothetical protein